MVPAILNIKTILFLGSRKRMSWVPPQQLGLPPTIVRLLIHALPSVWGLRIRWGGSIMLGRWAPCSALPSLEMGSPSLPQAPVFFPLQPPEL